MSLPLIGLHGRNAVPVALQSVQAIGQLLGPMLRMKLRQTYRNTSENNLECVYTFPLAWGSVLVGMAVELNGQRQTGIVTPKKQAEATYEKAIETGDLPVMLETSGKDLYTANLGNLQPGDWAVVEVEYAQLLRLEGGMLRLSLPTTIAPRYGDEHTQGGLAPHQTAAHSPRADYRLQVSLDLAKPLSEGTITSPSHGVQRVQHQGGVTVKLQSQAWLDRDFVLTVHGLKDMAFALASADATQPGQYTLLASAVAKWDTSPQHRAPLRMKVLVDGSGSMQGDSNAQARDALDGLLHQLQTDDEVSMTRFGSQTVHVLPRLQKCTEAYQRRLRAEARNIQADLGGTELERALRSVMAIPHEDEAPVEAASILLITDGAVWDIHNIVASVRQQGHRVFALGVGSSPAESLLRELAEVSGGACEMVSPKQSMQQAVARLLDRMRRSSSVTCHLLSDAPVVYQSPGFKEITQGDTLHQWAQLGSRPVAAPALQWTRAGQTFKSQAAQLIWDEDGILPRLCAAQRLLDTADEAQQSALSVQYQLLTKHTHFILVHERAAGDRSQVLPQLQQVPHMQAAGAGGHGTVIPTASSVLSSASSVQQKHPEFMSAKPIMASVSTPALWRSSRTHVAARTNSMVHVGMDNIEVPAFLRKQIDGDTAPTAKAASTSPAPANAPAVPIQPSAKSAALSILSPDCWRKQPQKIHGDPFSPLANVLQSLSEPNNPMAELLNTFNAQADGKRGFRSALSVTLSTARIAFMADFILHHAKNLGSPALVWAVLLLWLTDAHGLHLDHHARCLLEEELKDLDASARLAVVHQLEAAAAQNMKAA